MIVLVREIKLLLEWTDETLTFIYQQIKIKMK